MTILFYFTQFRNSVKRKGFVRTLKNSFIVILYPIYRRVVSNVILGSYAQYQEDLIIEKLLETNHLYYVDIGANSPDYISNTKRFYKKGSHGINIEPNKKIFKELETKRVRDLNLCIAITSNPHNNKLYVFNMKCDTYATIDKKQAEEWKSQGISLNHVSKISTTTLKQIFDKHYGTAILPHIDFMSIDADGSEYSILLSNDWNKYKPKVIIVETPDENVESLLKENGYKFYKETVWCDEPVNKIYMMNK